MRRLLPHLLVLAACRSAPPPAPLPAHPVFRFLASKYDADHDGRIKPGEYPRSAHTFRRLDADGDSLVTAADFADEFDGMPRLEGEFTYGEGGPELGEPAPDFTLPTTAGTTVSLASFRAHKPVVLVFGSFT